MSIKVTVVGLGYVGLPLARLLATKYSVVGFDINKPRIEALNQFLYHLLLLIMDYFVVLI